MNTVTSLRSVLRLRAPRLGTRNLVSAAFHCREDWAARLASPIFQRIKLGEFFVDLDRKFTNEYRGSAVDVDIFAQVPTIITPEYRYYHPCVPPGGGHPRRVRADGGAAVQAEEDPAHHLQPALHQPRGHQVPCTCSRQS